MPTIVNERAALRPTIYKSNGPAISLSQNAFELNRLVAMLFNRNEQGFFYDPNDLSTLHQDASGTIPVTDVGQPISVLVDKSKGAALGPELWNDATVVFSGGSSRLGPNRYNIKTLDGSYSGIAGVVPGGIINVWVVVEFTLESLSSGYVSSEFTGQFTTQKLGVNRWVTRSTSMNLTFKRSGMTDAIISNISVKRLLGNHAYQGTSASRPILQQTPILGNELVVNGDTSNGTDGWVTSNATLNITDGSFVMAASSQYGSVTKNISLDTSKTYELTLTVTGNTTNAPLTALIRPVSTTTNYATVSITTAGKYKLVFKPTAVSSRFMFQHGNATPTGSLSFTNVSIKEITGYRTDQNYIEYDGVDDKLITNLPSALTNCTVLRAVPNVGTEVKYNQTLPMLYEDATPHAGLITIDRALTRSEQLRLMTELDKKAGATSLETLTFKAFDNNQEGFVYDPNDLSTMYQDSAGTVPVTAVGQPVGLVLDKSKGLILGNNVAHKTSVIGQGIGGNEFKQVTVTDGLIQGKWYKVTITVSNYSGSGDLGLTSTNTPFPPSAVPTGVRSRGANGKIEFIAYATTTNSITLYTRSSNNADFTDISIQEIKGNHAYQTTSASRPILRKNAITGANYLEFDGTDDSLQTGNINFTATDKVSLFAGVRKLSDAYSALCIELGDGTSSALNAFALFAPAANGAMEYDLRNTVTGVGANTQDIRFNAPNSAVLAGTVTPNKVIKASLRVNGEAALTTQTGRSGSLVAAPLYIGRRGGTSLPFTGHIYGLIGIGKLTTDSETTAIEKEFAKRVGVALNV